MQRKLAGRPWRPVLLKRARKIGNAKHAVIRPIRRRIWPIPLPIEFAVAVEITPIGAPLGQGYRSAERVGVWQAQRPLGAMQFDRMIGMFEDVPGGAEGDGGA